MFLIYTTHTGLLTPADVLKLWQSGSTRAWRDFSSVGKARVKLKFAMQRAVLNIEFIIVIINKVGKKARLKLLTKPNYIG